MAHPIIDITDHRFGRLVAVYRINKRNSKRSYFWCCRCDCGKITFISLQNLRTKRHTQSCGCLKRETGLKAFSQRTTHNMARSPEYECWSAAKGRCYNPKDKRYAYYGERGITMCTRWRDSFEAFYADMGPRPDGLTLDRINNDGPYAPWNCRWATWKIQNNNKRQRQPKH